jgi:hypothetical protein
MLEDTGKSIPVWIQILQLIDIAEVELKKYMLLMTPMT